MEKIKTLSIDLETFSDIDLSKCGVYRYVESPAFEILLFGVSVNGGDVVVYDLAQGDKIPTEILGISDNTVRSFCRRNGLGDKSKNAVACKQCGKLIKNIPKQKPKKFCSDACRNTWWNEHQNCVNQKANYEYTCACCGRHFTAYGNDHRKYCSHACYITDRFRKGHISDE